MVSKILKKMEVLKGFIQIPAESMSELIGNVPLPCSTMLNGKPARIDKYGRLWSPYLKNRFSINTKIELTRTENGYHVTLIESNKQCPTSAQRRQKHVVEVRTRAENIWEFKKINGCWMPKVIFGDIMGIADYLPNNFIDCVITSPPYWMQRDYKHPAQIGREKTPEAYVEKIVSVFEKLRPKLKKTATIFLNVGYKYLSGELILIPEMIALEMKKKEFVLKNKIIWQKPNAMPTPARDRLNEVYEPVLFFVKNEGREVHYFNLEGISEKPKTLEHYTQLLSISPKKFLGAMVVDPTSERRVKKKGKVIGVRFVSDRVIEVLIRWENGNEEFVPLGDPLKSYPEKVSFICPICKETLSGWDVKLSFANLRKMVCPECRSELCNDKETFPMPQLKSVPEKLDKDVREIIEPNVESRRYISRAPKSSKFIKAGIEKLSMASPAGRLAIQGEYLTIKRRWDVPQLLIAKYLKYWRELSKITIEDVDKKLGYPYTAGHWFRLDFGWWGKGGSIPRPADWVRLKKLLGFNDVYDRLVTERVAVLQTVKPHEEGKNPGDVWKIMSEEGKKLGDVWRIVLEPYPEAHFSIFPRKLVETAMLIGCPPKGIVLDPFAGSGTVGEVAINLGRKAILIELIPEFLDLMKKRCRGRIEVLSKEKLSLEGKEYAK
jgi:DNA modification methylase